MIDTVLQHLSRVRSVSGGYVARCPAHDDQRASLSITEADDGKLLLHCHAGCTTAAIVEVMGLTMSELFPPKPAASKPKIVKVYPYRDETGTVVYEAVRYQPKDFRQRRPDPNAPGKYIYNLKNTKPLIYRLPEVIEGVKAGKGIIIVEGEKDVETLVSKGFKYATCNSGGAGKFPKTMARYFRGANVTLIPDNDAPGSAHAGTVATLLHDTAVSITVVDLPGLPDKGDVSDWFAAGGTREELIKIITDSPQWQPPTPSSLPAPPPNTSTPAQNTHDLKSSPFRLLGYNAGKYYFLSHETRQISAYTSKDLVKSNLTAIAPLSWWSRVFHGDNGVNWAAAVDALQRESAKVGIFDPRMLRGLGAWFDEGRVVIHLGNHLVVDGQDQDAQNFDSRFIYEAGYPQEKSNFLSAPISLNDANKLLDICKMFTWEKPISATFLAGWCVIAPLSGVLHWHPHIHLVGESGSGKTWIKENVIHQCLGKASLRAKADTTAAALVRELHSNAYPICLEEVKGKDRFSADRLRQLLELARAASSDDGDPIIKADNGNPKHYHIRSCMQFISTTAIFDDKADSRRFTILTLKKAHQDDRVEIFEQIQSKALSTFTPEWCAGLRARNVQMIPTLLENIKAFTSGSAQLFGDQGIGDQLGALLAGAYLLTSNKIITPKQAYEWLSAQDWSEQSIFNTDTDQQRALNDILQSMITINVNGTRHERSIHEVVINLDRDENGKAVSDTIDIDTCRQTLFRYGVKVSDGKLYIQNINKEMKKLLFHSEFCENWKDQLRRLPGATTEKSVRFGYNVSTGICIPIEII